MAVGGFAIGTGEFVILGLLPNVAHSLSATIPQAGHLVSAYALGVVIGAPLLTVACIRIVSSRTPSVHPAPNRRRHPISAMGVSTALVMGSLSVVAVAVTASPALGAPEPGTALSSGTSGEPNTVSIYGASDEGVVYWVFDQETSSDGSFFMKAAGQAPSPLPTSFGNFPSPTVVGNIIGNFDDTSRVFTYTTFDGSRSGAVTVPAGTFLSASVDGYLYAAVAPTTTATHIYDVNIATDVSTDLGTLPDSPTSVYDYPTTFGVVIVSQVSTAESEPEDVFYASYAAPGQLTQLGASVPLASPISSDANTVAWVENPTGYGDNGDDYNPADTTVVQVTVDGSPIERATDANVSSVAVTAGYVAIVHQPPGEVTGSLATAPVGSSNWIGLSGLVSYGVWSTGTNFVVDREGDPTTAGLYSMPSAAGPVTQLVEAGAATYTAESVAVSPGRAAWVDNGVGAGTWTAPLTTNGSNITAGSATIVGAAETAPDLVASSGDRTAYVLPDTLGSSLWVTGPGAASHEVGASNADVSLTLSGSRLLENLQNGSAVVHNLADGTSTTFAAPAGWQYTGMTGAPYDLSGNRMASLAGDGSVWIQDLETGARTEVSDPTSTAGQTVEGTVAVSGDAVAWSEQICTPGDPTVGPVTFCVNQPLQYRTIGFAGGAVTLGSVETVNGASPMHLALSDGYLAYDNEVNATNSWDVEVRALDASTSTDVAPLGGNAFVQHFAVSGSTLIWVGADLLPHVLALTPVPTPPLFLGNGIAPASLAADGTNHWNAEFVASQALTSCAVSITAGSTVVRTLPCDATQTNLGEAVVSWDGKDANGGLVAAGTYAWTLTGSNADGSLLDAEGSNAAITGTITTTAPAPTGGGTMGGTTGGGGSFPTLGSPTPTSTPTSATGTVAAGGSVSTNGGEMPTASDPLTVTVTTPVAGDIVLTVSPNPAAAHAGDRPLDDVTISAPAASAATPLRLTFQLYVGSLPANSYLSDLVLFRNGTAIDACTGSAVAAPDPCVTTSTLSGSVATVTVLSSHASRWQLESAAVGRLAGTDRFGTAVAVSQAEFPFGSEAGAVVLARADDYADALVGGPLAAAKHAPLLLTEGATLPDATRAELTRVLGSGGTVYLLGGNAAVPASVESQLNSLGYQTVRLAGSDRYATAVAVAAALGDPKKVMLATGTNYPDALSAGPAAAHVGAAVLLTNGATMPAETAAYLSAHATTAYAIGIPAAVADPAASSVSGADRYATSVAVAEKFFTTPVAVGVTTGQNFPDALAAGGLLAQENAPLILTATTGLPAVAATYLTSVEATAAVAHVFGGNLAVPANVVEAIGSALGR